MDVVSDMVPLVFVFRETANDDQRRTQHVGGHVGGSYREKEIGQGRERNHIWRSK